MSIARLFRQAALPLVIAALLPIRTYGQWSTPQLLNTAAERATGDVKTPEIAAAAAGGFHSRYLIVVSGNSKVKYRRYNGGLQTPVQVAAPSFVANGDIAEAGNGDIHVTWEDWAGSVNNVGSARSTNGGANWTTSILTSGGGGKFPLLAAYGASNSADMIQSNYNTIPLQLQFHRWNGTSWTGTTNFQAADSEYYIMGICRSHQDGSVFRSYGRKLNATTYRLAYRRYNGSGWDPEVIVNDMGFFARQDIAVNQSGHVMVTWDANNGSFSRLFIPGTGWGAVTTLSSASAHNSVAAVPGTNDFYSVYAAYTGTSPQKVRGRHFTGGAWGAEEVISVGLADAFSVNSRVAVAPDRTVYCAWEYWGASVGTAPNVVYSIRTPLPGGGGTPYAASFVSLSAPSTMVAGSTATVTVTLTNSGTSSWDTTNTRVGTSNPRDRSSAFYNSADWLGASRPTAVNAATAPGANGAFTFIAKAPLTTGAYSEQFELLQEGVTWFGGTGDDFTWNVTVTPNTGTISGTVTDSVTSAAVSGATVSTNVGGYSTTTAANGTYTLSNVTAGTYNVTASKTNYNSLTNNGVVVNAGATTTSNFALVPLPGSITGTVTASGGGAISGATVSTNVGGYTTTTNASGQYTLSNVTEGTYNVTASKSGYVSSTVNGVVVNPNAATTVNFTLTPNAPFEHISNGNMEGGFFATGWATTCSGQTSKLPNPSGTWGWNEDATYPFNTYDKTGTVHGGTHSLGFAFCQTAGDPGKLGIAFQSINLGSPNATGTFSCWGYNTNGNCPSIMCWNPGNNQTDPYVANNGGRLLWICGAGNNWTTLNTWQTNSMTVTADASGYVTIMVGGASWPGTSSGAPLYIDDVSVMAP